jgi:hypothetical protein
MSASTSTVPSTPFERDEDGNFRPLTAEQSLAVVSTWAMNYPTARFVVVAMAQNGWDAEVLGWGLALPDHVFAHLPKLRLTTRFRTAGALVALLGHAIDTRLVWVDPEPEHWPAEPEASDGDR